MKKHISREDRGTIFRSTEEVEMSSTKTSEKLALALITNPDDYTIELCQTSLILAMGQALIFYYPQPADKKRRVWLGRTDTTAIIGSTALPATRLSTFTAQTVRALH